MVSHPHSGWVPMYVAEETLVTSILHLDGTFGHKREKCSVHLETDVFSGAEGSTDTTQLELNAIWGYSQACCNLLLILMKPLCSNMHDNPSTVSIWNC
jgi:hypothetical protein